MKVLIAPEPEPPTSKVSGSSRAYYSTSFHYLRLYLKYTYYVGLCPFRFDITQDGFKLRSHKLQKGFCALIHLLAATASVYWTYTRWPQYKVVTSPWLLFKNGYSLTILSYWPVFIWTFWTKQDTWLDFFRACDQQPHLPRPTESNVKWSWKKSILVQICLLIPISFMIQMMSSLSSFDIGEYGGGGGTNSTNLTAETPEMAVEWVESVWGGIGATIWTVLKSILSSVCMMVVTYVEVLPFISVMVLRHVSLEFEEVLKDEELSEDTVFAHYLHVKKIVDHLNSAVSPFLLLNLCMGLMYYSLGTIMIFDSDSVESKITDGGGLIMLIVTAIIAVRAAGRIGNIKKWIMAHNSNSKDYDKRHQLSSSSLVVRTKGKGTQTLLMYAHVCDEPVGLNCGPLFTITNHSLGTGLGLLATYTIIVLQLYSSPSILPPSPDYFYVNGMGSN